MEIVFIYLLLIIVRTSSDGTLGRIEEMDSTTDLKNAQIPIPHCTETV
jgi:hypothetical protein